MKRLRVGCAALGVLILQAGALLAQSTLDALQQELDEARQLHHDATTQSLTNFFSQVDPAMASPDAAVALWQQAGGPMPAPTPVTTVHDLESASERDARLAQDKKNADALGLLLQVHCGLLHYGAIFVTDPNRQGLKDDFNTWLQKAAQAYPQLIPPPPPAPASGDNGDAKGGDADGQSHHHHNAGAGAVPAVNLGSLKKLAMRDSLISKFLVFKDWADSDQGGWAVKDIPDFYKTNILDPSRTTPNAATLTNWDTYIAMAQADETDPDKWTATDYPPLQFQRACDDYAITPNTDKIEALVQIIHANPTHPQADDWITQTKQLLDEYSAKHGGRPMPSTAAQNPAPPAATNSNVTVTTVQQGDAQVIITHTNATPNPARP